MIHSLSGGVIADNGIYTFVKVDVAGMPRWYLSGGLRVKAGDHVRVPDAGGEKIGVVIRTEDCTRQTAPVPFKRAAAILAVTEEKPQQNA